MLYQERFGELVLETCIYIFNFYKILDYVFYPVVQHWNNTNNNYSINEYGTTLFEGVVVFQLRIK